MGFLGPERLVVRTLICCKALFNGHKAGQPSRRRVHVVLAMASKPLTLYTAGTPNGKYFLSTVFLIAKVRVQPYLTDLITDRSSTDPGWHPYLHVLLHDLTHCESHSLPNKNKDISCIASSCCIELFWDPSTSPYVGHCLATLYILDCRLESDSAAGGAGHPVQSPCNRSIQK